MTCVVDDDGRLMGIITDGDLRRHLASDANIRDRTASDVMTIRPVTIPPDTLAAEVLHKLELRKITAVVVVSGDNKALGVVQLHDLWRIQMF
jgi:arabinose-5-phosphate isomerase